MVKKIAGINQKSLIDKKDWDCLVILDACRYDYFKELYSKYLSGTFKKVKTPAFETTQWLTETFEKGQHKDIVYVSANPYVNSQGIEADRFDARGKFYRVVDLWDRGWDEDLKTVRPETVTRVARRARAFFPDKRLVVHYMQPHYPFITLGPVRGLTPPDERRAHEGTILSAMNRRVSILIQRHFGPRTFWVFSELRRLVFSGPPHAVELVAQKHGKGGLREGYKENLRIALRSVSELSGTLPGKMIVSSDHGYLLGENDEYAQMSFRSPHLLYNVPWLEVE